MRIINIFKFLHLNLQEKCIKINFFILQIEKAYKVLIIINCSSKTYIIFIFTLRIKSYICVEYILC